MRKKSIHVMALVLAGVGLVGGFAQETIAVHPLDNSAETPLEDILYEELVFAIPDVPNYEGMFDPYLIDLIYDLPEDVPEGGFPPYICPPVSLTKGAPFAITGEIGEDPEYPDEYWVRLYLWETESGELMVSDMVSVFDRESAADNYPYMLEYLFSKIEDRRKVGRGTPSDFVDPRYGEMILRYDKYWLYLGLQAGAGTATWELNSTVTDSFNLSFGLLGAVTVFYPLSVQLELNMQGHFDVADAGDGSIMWNMAIPLLLRYKLFNTGTFNASVYGGHWLLLNLSIPDTVDSIAVPAWNSAFGNVYGLTIGWELGPMDGSLFLDGRFYHLMDFVDFSMVRPFHGFVFSVGYQIGLIEKQKK